MDDFNSPVGSTLLKWSSVGKRIIADVPILMMLLLVGFVALEIRYAFARIMFPGLGDTLY